jgi:hypothetical protein
MASEGMTNVLVEDTIWYAVIADPACDELPALDPQPTSELTSRAAESARSTLTVSALAQPTIR